MAVIDLETGDVTGETEKPTGGIIDLDTGAIVQPSPSPSQAPQQAPGDPSLSGQVQAGMEAGTFRTAPGERAMQGAIDTSVAVGAQFANKGNAGLINFADLLAETGNLSAGGYRALSDVLAGVPLNDAVREIQETRPLPTATEAIDGLIAKTGLDLATPGTTDYMEPGIFKDIVDVAGTLYPVIFGMQPVPGRDITRVAGQAAELGGFGAAQPAQAFAGGAPARQAGTPMGRLSEADAARAFPESTAQRSATVDALPPATLDDVADGALPPPGDPDVMPTRRGMPSKKVRKDLGMKREENAYLARYKYDDAGNVVDDPVARKALRMGVEEGEIKRMKTATRGTKARMAEMLDILEKRATDARYADTNQTDNVPGRVIADRLGIVRQTNRVAGKRIDDVAKSQLKNTQVMIRPAIQKFVEDLMDPDKLGVGL